MFMTSSAYNIYYKNVNSNYNRGSEKSERSEGNSSRLNGIVKGSTGHGWECVKVDATDGATGSVKHQTRLTFRVTGGQLYRGLTFIRRRSVSLNLSHISLCTLISVRRASSEGWRVVASSECCDGWRWMMYLSE